MKYFLSDPIALYDSDITSAIPHTAVEISDEQYEMLIAGQENGEIISADSNGMPVLIEPPPPTHEELIAAAEQVRQQLLVQADATMLDWRTELMLGEISDANRAKLSAWLAYKNDVKSIDVTTDPEHVSWPVPPEV
ncbi:tail fiber assembly protein [Citrobacter sedlakii]|uniref:tail fiber assembly protein n=1 Tax=Citrobacter sedlakii TaxID=67826 RepID=UPI002B226C9A|nr:tail fiber assembly protein [Citrobacter sedlakii]MEB0952028.1 tail fiber assembly protein [Citrobacter sedlakii]